MYMLVLLHTPWALGVVGQDTEPVCEWVCQWAPVLDVTLQAPNDKPLQSCLDLQRGALVDGVGGLVALAHEMCGCEDAVALHEAAGGCCALDHSWDLSSHPAC